MASQTQSQKKVKAKKKAKRQSGPQRSAVVLSLEQTYITSPEFLSIEKLAEHELCFNKNGTRKKGASLDNLRVSCTELNWVKKREDYWERASAKALEQSNNQATKIIASQYDFADQLKRMSMQSVNQEIRNRLAKHLANGGTPENFVPLEMHEAMPVLFRAMGVERDLLQITEADLDADDGLIEIDDEDYEAIKELTEGN